MPENKDVKSYKLILKNKDLLRHEAFVDGKWISTESKLDVTDPASGALIAKVPDCDVEILRTAIDSAENAFQTYKRTTARERSNLLKKLVKLMRDNFDDLAQLITVENGKILKDSRAELEAGIGDYEWFAEEAPHDVGDVILSEKKDTRIITIRQPIGVCGIMTPWNFPTMLPARKIGAALATGCTCVVKPASATPLSALAVAYLIEQAGFPKGTVNVVTAAHSNVREISHEISTNPKIRKITFTGSTSVGKDLMKQASSTVKACSFELGGNASFVVYDDACVKTAVESIATSKLQCNGQVCVCVNRVLIHEKIHDEVVRGLVKLFESLNPGHGLDENTTSGPLIRESAVENIESLVKDAQEKGGKVLVGGKRLPDLGPNFYAPTIIVNANESMRAFKEEIFGPIVLIYKFGDHDNPLAMSNKTQYGLAHYVFTENLTRAIEAAEELETGMVAINQGWFGEPALPFGGVKESGFGRECSKYGMDEYVTIKSISIKLSQST